MPLRTPADYAQDMQGPKDKGKDEHAETEVLESDGDLTPDYDPDATAVLAEDLRKREESPRKRSK
jgi:hypothetical protein